MSEPWGGSRELQKWPDPSDEGIAAAPPKPTLLLRKAPGSAEHPKAEQFCRKLANSSFSRTFNYFLYWSMKGEGVGQRVTETGEGGGKWWG